MFGFTMFCSQETDWEFHVGEEFDSFKAFEDKLIKYQERTYTLFTVYRSEKSDNELLQYHWRKYKCKHYGTPRKNPAATGKRALQK